MNVDEAAESERLRASAERDQLWASLRALLPEIQRLARGEYDGSDREKQLICLLAGIVTAELSFRANPSD